MPISNHPRTRTRSMRILSSPCVQAPMRGPHTARESMSVRSPGYTFVLNMVGLHAASSPSPLGASPPHLLFTPHSSHLLSNTKNSSQFTAPIPQLPLHTSHFTPGGGVDTSRAQTRAARADRSQARGAAEAQASAGAAVEARASAALAAPLAATASEAPRAVARGRQH